MIFYILEASYHAPPVFPSSDDYPTSFNLLPKKVFSRAVTVLVYSPVGIVFLGLHLSYSVMPKTGHSIPAEVTQCLIE